MEHFFYDANSAEVTLISVVIMGILYFLGFKKSSVFYICLCVYMLITREGKILLVMFLLVGVLTFVESLKKKNLSKKKEETIKNNDEKIKIDWQEMEEKNQKRIKEQKQQEVEKEKIKNEDVENFTNTILKHTIYKNFCIDLKKTLIKNNEVNNLKVENFFSEYNLYDGFVISSNSCDVITEIQKFLIERDIFLKIEKINYEYIFYTTEQIKIIVKNIFFENKILQSVGVVLEKEITKINIAELLKSPLAKKYIKTK